MKKWILLGAMMVIILGVVVYNTKFFYPPLPIDSVSKKEVLETLNDSSKDMAKIAKEDDYEWYIARMDQSNRFESVKQMLSQKEWDYKTQEGSGYFFEKNDRKLVVYTQMWTGKYVIVSIPNDWKD
ncbi:hypothetical protein ACFSTA_03300 [Ornithinibacillus salinisoli]|uniref:Uncharacterized protein n=1 Tax=Ornithinibacillus salinisoli TaxID=1848459 RepID=A0ABW4VXB6_9BACI